jgi:hypothetical protein
MIRQVTLVFLASVLPIACFGQGVQSQPVPAPTQQPSAEANEDPAASSPAGKPKKVWTNDDLKGAGKVSVIGSKGGPKYTMTKAPDPATISRYKTNLQKLQSQLDEVNKQLQAFEDFAEGKPVSESGRDMNHGYSRVPVNQQTTKLFDKKKQLEDQMDALYDEARKQGIESGMLK